MSVRSDPVRLAQIFRPSCHLSLDDPDLQQAISNIACHHALFTDRYEIMSPTIIDSKDDSEEAPLPKFGAVSAIRQHRNTFAHRLAAPSPLPFSNQMMPAYPANSRIGSFVAGHTEPRVSRNSGTLPRRILRWTLRCIAARSVMVSGC